MAFAQPFRFSVVPALNINTGKYFYNTFVGDITEDAVSARAGLMLQLAYYPSPKFFIVSGIRNFEARSFHDIRTTLPTFDHARSWYKWATRNNHYSVPLYIGTAFYVREAIYAEVAVGGSFGIQNISSVRWDQAFAHADTINYLLGAGHRPQQDPGASTRYGSLDLQIHTVPFIQFPHLSLQCGVIFDLTKTPTYSMEGFFANATLGEQDLYEVSYRRRYIHTYVGLSYNIGRRWKRSLALNHRSASDRQNSD